MARPRASEEQRHQQRKLLQRAAAEIFRESGVAAVTVRAVCKRAGVSTGTLYSYFASSGELLRSLWVAPVAKANNELEAIAAHEPDPVRRLQALLTAYAQFAIDQPHVFRSALLFVRPDTIAEPVKSPTDEVVFYRLLRTSVEEGQASGSLQPGNPDTVTHVLWAGIHGALALPVNVETWVTQSQSALADAMILTLMAAITEPASSR